MVLRLVDHLGSGIRLTLAQIQTHNHRFCVILGHSLLLWASVSPCVILWEAESIQ